MQRKTILVIAAILRLMPAHGYSEAPSSYGNPPRKEVPTVAAPSAVYSVKTAH